jgi:hypothetical protein
MLFSEKNKLALIIVSAIFSNLAGEGRLAPTLFSGGWRVPETMFNADLL